MIKALAVDIDGTLTDMNRVLCPASLQAMRGLEVPVILSTGNTHCFSRTVSILLGTPRIFIAENGGVLSYSDGVMEVLADQRICEAAFQRLSEEFALKKYESSRHKYRFTDVIVKNDSICRLWSGGQRSSSWGWKSSIPPLPCTSRIEG